MIAFFGSGLAALRFVSVCAIILNGIVKGASRERQKTEIEHKSTEPYGSLMAKVCHFSPAVARTLKCEISQRTPSDVSPDGLSFPPAGNRFPPDDSHPFDGVHYCLPKTMSKSISRHRTTTTAIGNAACTGRNLRSNAQAGGLSLVRLLTIGTLLLLLAVACEDRPELRDGAFLAVSDIDRGDGWVAWLYAEVEGGVVQSARFDYVHRETGDLYTESEGAVRRMYDDYEIEPSELFRLYAELFAETPGPVIDVEDGPRSVSRHISALAIGVVEASTRGLEEPVLVSAPGDGTAIDGRKIVSFLPVDLANTE